jgi:quercetin dioxygenase-like cupin family protein
MLHPLRQVAAIVLVSSVALAGTVVLASPGTGITSEILVTGDLNEEVNYNHDRVKLQTKGRIDVRVQKLTFAAGSRTGWHHHPAVVIVSVASGSVTITDGNCGSKTYGPGLPAGSVFVEGHDSPMEASSTTGGVVYATYVAPDATPPVFRIEDNAVTCPPS